MQVSPAEALVLLEGDTDTGPQAVKLTVMALVMQSVLRLEKTRVPRRLFGTRTATCVKLLRPAPVPTPRHVGVVVQHVGQARHGELGPFMASLGKATQNFTRFVPDFVVPELVRRGFMEQRTTTAEKRKLLGGSRMVSTTTIHFTAAGLQERDRLRRMLHEAQDLPRQLDANPARAAAMALALGGLIVLIPGILPFLGDIAHAVNQAQIQPSQDSGSGDGGSSSESTIWQEVDYAALAGVDTALSEVDAAVESAIESAESAGGDGDSGGDSDGGGSDGGGSDGGGSDGGGSDGGGSDGGGGE